MNRLDELQRMGRFVMYSPSRRFCYIMGLIDYLGKWNMNKRLEMLGKSLRAHFIRQNTDFSVKPPDEFARRFIKKVKRIFRVEKQSLQQRVDTQQPGYSFYKAPSMNGYPDKGLSFDSSRPLPGMSIRGYPSHQVIEEEAEEVKDEVYESHTKRLVDRTAPNQAMDQSAEFSDEASYHPKYE